jgi:Gpi18-like mannosyltransferase
MPVIILPVIRFSSAAIPRWVWQPALAFGVTRLGIALVAYLAEALMADNVLPPPYHLRPDNILLDVFGSRWDTGFYLSIAQDGYRYTGVPLPSVAFFPLLPLLIRAVSLLARDPVLAGLIVTNLALLVASILLFRLTADEFGDGVANRAVWYLLLFPTSFFGSAIYSESLFLAGALGALYCARKGMWESAGLLGFLTALSRFMGLIVAPLLLLEWWTQRRRSPPESRPRWWALAMPLMPFLATGAYMLYLRQAFGDPLAFVRASEAWGRVAGSPLTMFMEMLQRPAEGWGAALLAGRLPLDNWIDALAVLAFLIFGGVLLHQRRWSEAAFVLLGVLAPLSSGLWMSQRRYVWVLFPAFILLARWAERPWIDRTITTGFALGLGLSTALFANWYWVG